jgi:putative DNA primase/helicase
VGTVEAMVRAYAETITCDPIPDLINFGNGLLRWRTGELYAHTHEIPTTVQLDVDYDPDATCPAFEEFIAEVVPEDVVPTIWELIGYLMYSGNPLHKAVMLTGSGRNGKGTFLRAIESVLGSRNVTSVGLHDLVNTRFTTASLFGKLANIAGDIDATYMENTATFKGITGGDTISAEHKGRDRFDFKPWAVPMFSANRIPASADTSVGYLSRWLVVPFPNDFTGREDRHLDDRLHTAQEQRGIAARGIRALEALLDRGDFALTASGELAREEFMRRVDQVRTWLAECCEIHLEHPWVARTELYELYKNWAARDGHKAVRASEFYDRVEAAGAEPATIHGTRGFKRIRVIDNGWATGVGARWGTPILPEGPAPIAPVATPTVAPEVPQQPTKAVPAPTSQDGKTAGQPQSFCPEGAEGAETPHPPIARDAQVGGLAKPAPSAPTPDERPVKAKREQTAEAREKKLQAAAEKRAAAIAEAAGEHIGLPALVTRDGVPRAAELGDLDALLATITELTVDVETLGLPRGARRLRPAHRAARQRALRRGARPQRPRSGRRRTPAPRARRDPARPLRHRRPGAAGRCRPAGRRRSGRSLGPDARHGHHRQARRPGLHRIGPRPEATGHRDARRPGALQARRRGPGRAVQGRQVADRHRGHHRARALRLGPGRLRLRHDGHLRGQRRPRRRGDRQGGFHIRARRSSSASAQPSG